jgi:hypothetical protein
MWGVKQGLRTYKYTYFKAVLLNTRAAYVSYSQLGIKDFQTAKIKGVAHKFCFFIPINHVADNTSPGAASDY